MAKIQVVEADVFEVIATTRAIRRLKPDPVPLEYIHTVLWAATRAPSGSNRQPWRFIVIDDPEKKRQLQELYFRGWQRYLNETIGGATRRRERTPEERASIERTLKAAEYLARHLDEVPVLILACTVGEPGSGGSIFPALQNLMLAARALGLGSSLTTLLRHHPEDVRRILDLPDHVHYVALIPIGWPLGRFGSGPRKPVEAVAYLNTWGTPWPLKGDQQGIANHQRPSRMGKVPSGPSKGA